MHPEGDLVAKYDNPEATEKKQIGPHKPTPM